MSLQPQAETLSFEAEVKQLLHLVAHSLYSNKEIFLRELISNSSDAADKLRYQALSDAALYENDADLKIWIDFDKDNRTITIRDNGIGMSREEVIENLGTIAKSGTRAFRELLAEKKAEDSQLIGQFGVGFYSAFIVADRVVVRTRRAGMKADQGVEWESTGEGEYTLKNIDKPTRGTEVVLHLKESEEEFLDPLRLRAIITKYSDHILLPIVMKKIKTSGADDEDKNETPEEEVVNRANALWVLPKDKIKDEEYKELYKHIAHDFEDPLAWVHNKVEGKLEYTTLLYIPARAPFDLWNREGQRGLKLYVKRIFIMDDAEHFMPMYLRFVKGIVDSNDLPLNISRELLQSNEVINKIKAGCVKRILSLLEDLAKNDKEKYASFWKAFGQVLKEGPAEDFANRDRIANLLRFASTHNDTDEQNVSLQDYISRMKPEQNKIYYIVADTYTSAKNSPLLEVFRKKDIEVLLMSDRVDEWLVAHLNEFEGKSLQSIAKGTLDLGDLEKEEKVETEKFEKDFDELLKQFKEVLGEKIKDVRITHRLTDSPTCVVFDENEMSGHLQRLLIQTGQDFMQAKPILEINPSHPLILRVKNESDKTRFNRWADLLLNQALLAEGEQLKDPASFVKGLNELLLDS
ncbi:molecular chaperone HtpG [Coxiella burnetii]|uniref:Chaperone protein HtpG n=2 Tax=Coxiella burnetii (strain RSA 493 / Nine Mile phase I) TaxID=227377 RepID=HTPG_COXBU|nr:molecular chaperone HtpG [Coxiella burnetii]Q83EL0.1 RecName: Full=Chaperone protein HtpG; AltName: Full=Heat shock protein HtpG; AltName: Full=High temperature protein G [Coxiella burnetii RSA 493]AML49703.1 molecular chaperone HtpG [Coxiella burnetii]AML55599.1 molecular chaperone HtpG [Coxiella burnetii]APQ67011.1 molecular chaperone HtpG [Coxiella burnetii 'MSU Goat Q177']ARK26696.1 molecular chaperone HtpG [Coxiella burnetii]ATN69581.1 molecular chaperone HtpG [Coxiella burnetii]